MEVPESSEAQLGQQQVVPSADMAQQGFAEAEIKI
jgi:hypothetical protein